MLRLIRGARPAPEGKAAAPHDELAELARAVVRGEPGAARSFVFATAEPVRRAVLMVLGSAHPDAEDATQDAMLGILNALPRFRGECSVTQFSVRVAVLTAMAVRRRQQNRERWIVQDSPETERISADPASSPLAHVESARRRQAIRRLLDELQPRVAEAVVLYFMLGYSVPEIASMAQASANTIWSRLRIGRERMKRALDGDHSLSEELDERSQEDR